MKTITYDDTQWQLVPKNATHEMCLAAHDGPNCGAEYEMRASDREYWEACYLAMLSAAPNPPAQPINLEEVGAQFNSLGQMTHVAQPAERKPLTDERTADLWNAARRENLVDHVHKFKRAIEAAHGITEP